MTELMTLNIFAIASRLLQQNGVKEQRLLINRVRTQYGKMELMPDLDVVIDQTGVQLIGVVPEDPQIIRSGAKGIPLPESCRAYQAFDNIGKRITGQYCPLAIG